MESAQSVAPVKNLISSKIFINLLVKLALEPVAKGVYFFEGRVFEGLHEYVNNERKC